MTIHHVKSWPHLYAKAITGEKTHDMRRSADRDYKVGDILVLQEYNQKTFLYTGREAAVEITYITSADNPCALSDNGLKTDYIILSINLIGELKDKSPSIREPMQEEIFEDKFKYVLNGTEHETSSNNITYEDIVAIEKWPLGSKPKVTWEEIQKIKDGRLDGGGQLLSGQSLTFNRKTTLIITATISTPVYYYPVIINDHKYEHEKDILKYDEICKYVNIGPEQTPYVKYYFRYNSKDTKTGGNMRGLLSPGQHLSLFGYNVQIIVATTNAA